MDKVSHRKNKSILLLGASLITFGCVLAVTSLAWFCPPQSSHSVSGGITGKATGSYFESGNGSSSSPYIIATPRQLYYFNWLQDLGYFNTDSDNDGTIDTVYFKIKPKDGSKELDMGKYVLPPAGTSAYPFVGNFDGNEVVLKDLTITNSYTELNEDGMRPIKASEDSSVSGMLSDAEIVGFFGVIGQYSTEAYGSTKVTNDDESTTTTITGHASETSSQKSLPYNIRVEDKDKDGKETTTTYINAVNDLYFENLTIKSAANSVLAGFIAGYANGQIDNCGVQCGQFSFVDGVSNFSDDVLTETSLSKYALIGDCTSNLKWKGQPGVDDGGTAGNDWGGSINIYEFSKRVTYIMNDSMTANGITGAIASPNKFNLNTVAFRKVNSPSNSFYEIQNLSSQIYGNSYLPIKVDSSKEFDGGEITGSQQSSYKSTWSWKTATTSFFSGTASEELIDDTNPGYITSRSSGDNQSTWHYTRTIDRIKNSFGGTSYDPDKLVMLTYDGSNFVRIADGDNVTKNTSLNTDFPNTVEASSLHKYTDVKNYFSKVYTEGNSSLIYTLGWQKADISSIEGTFKMDTGSGSSQLVTYTSALAPGIDFYVKKAGYIGVVYCAMGNQGYGNNLFSLYKVDRSSGTATKGDQITDGIPSDTGDKFDKDYCILYLEIEVDAGEYFITTDSNWSKSTNADFMYLDIGANSGDEEEKTTDPLPTNIDFVYKNEGSIVKITEENYAPSGVTFALSGSGSSSGLLYFKRNTSSSGVIYYVETGYSVTVAGLEKNAVSKKTKEEYDNATA